MKFAPNKDAGDERKKLLMRYTEMRQRLEGVPVGGLTVGQFKEAMHILSSGQHPESPTQHGGDGWLKETIAKMEKLITRATRQKKQKK